MESNSKMAAISLMITEQRRQMIDETPSNTAAHIRMNLYRSTFPLLFSSYREKHLLFRCNKQNICKNLEEMEAIIGDSFSQKPASYKAALAQWKKSKASSILKILVFLDFRGIFGFEVCTRCHEDFYGLSIRYLYKLDMKEYKHWQSHRS